MAKTITAPVGRKGALNLIPDVIVVQDLLNKVPETSGGPRVKLIVNGNCGNDTSDAIHRFQLHHFGYLADGRVDPGGPTLKRLNDFDSSSPPTGPTLPRPGAGQILGQIVNIVGSAKVVSYGWGVVTEQAATVGMIVRPYMVVQGASNNTHVTIQLTNGHRITLNGSSMLSTSI